MERRWLYKEMAPFAGMVAAECANVGSNTIFKAATAQANSISYYAYTVYASIVASLFILPFALIFRRSPELPSNKISFFLKLICLSAIGLSCQLLGYKGLDYSSPTLSSAISNLIPAFTFILALLFRMEKLALKRSSSIVKIIGSVVSISGALVVVLYKGPVVLSNPYSAGPTTTTLGLNHHHPLGSSQPNWILGGLCFVLQYFLNSVWYILQTHLIRLYPDELIVVAMYYAIQAILSAPVCLFAEPDMSAWKIRSGLALLAVLNSGCMGQSFVTAVHTWGLHLKGPVYVSSFRPLSIAIAAAMGAIFLGDHLYLGSVIGGIIISSGFYAILWGKAKEEEELLKEESGNYCSLESASSTTGKTPLLQYYNKVEGG